MSTIRLKNIRILDLENGKYSLKPCSMRIDTTTSVILDIDFHTDAKDGFDFQNDILIPRLFNIHCHLGEHHFRSIDGNDWTILRYLEYTNQFNDNLSKEEVSRTWEESAEKTLCECIQYGTGGICAGRAAKAVEKTNLHCMAGYPLMNTKKLDAYTKRGIDGFLAYKEHYEQQRCNVGLLMHSLYANDRDSIHTAAECLEKGAGFFAIHLSEDRKTRQLEIEKCKKKPVCYLDSNGLITDKTIIVHGGCLDDEELRILSQRHSIVAICPISNEFLNTAPADINKLNAYGIEWCIATDGPATGRTMSLLKQSKKIVTDNPKIHPADVFKAMTTIPARLYNRSIYQGVFRVGTEAVGLKIKHTVKSCDELIEGIVNDTIPYEEFDVTKLTPERHT